MSGYRDLKDLITPVCPDLLDRVKKEIEQREQDFVQRERESVDSFLWEHTLHVALYARRLSLLEKTDPLLPVLAALFHDMGKFDGGRYHRDEIPEEKKSAGAASGFLHRAGFKNSDIDHIVSGLNSLYDEKSKANMLANILHDADFLAKAGYLGVAEFFTKSALKGQNLSHALSLHLSKELTYASLLAANMRTSAGRKIAVQKAKDSLAFYQGLLEELADSGISRFTIVNEELPCPSKHGKILKIVLAIPSECPSCRGELRREYSFEQGIKCTELIGRIRCSDCSYSERISFCLPELPG